TFHCEGVEAPSPHCLHAFEATVAFRSRRTETSPAAIPVSVREAEPHASFANSLAGAGHAASSSAPNIFVCADPDSRSSVAASAIDISGPRRRTSLPDRPNFLASDNCVVPHLSSRSSPSSQP
ncbi:hypothetical protein Csa_011095, partial [Cucumis sativus]